MTAGVLIKGYAICALARTGSSYLCDLLSSTGVLGRPEEYFNVTSMRDLEELDYPEEAHAQLAFLQRCAATPNGVYGLKVLVNHLDQPRSCGWTERLPALSFIHLERRDLLARAISYVRARQTNLWSSYSREAAEPTYDGKAIQESLVVCAQEESRWRRYFARQGLRPLHLTYEQVLADPQGVVDAVARTVGLDDAPQITPEQSRFKIQRDPLTEAWRDRFISEYRNLGVFD